MVAEVANFEEGKAAVLNIVSNTAAFSALSVEEAMKAIGMVPGIADWAEPAEMLAVLSDAGFSTASLVTAMTAAGIDPATATWDEIATLTATADASGFSTASIASSMSAAGISPTTADFISDATLAVTATDGTAAGLGSLVTSLSSKGIGIANGVISGAGNIAVTTTDGTSSGLATVSTALNTLGLSVANNAISGTAAIAITTTKGQMDLTVEELNTLVTAGQLTGTFNAAVTAQVDATVNPIVSAALYASAAADYTAAQSLNTITGGVNTLSTVNTGVVLGQWDVIQTLGYLTTAINGLPPFDYGGIASGPETGYVARLHGTELVVSPKMSYPVSMVNGGSTREGSREEEVQLLREQNALLSTIVAQNSKPMKIEGLGRFTQKVAEGVVVSRNSRGKEASSTRYY
jgi:hypothetical protein